MRISVRRLLWIAVFSFMFVIAVPSAVLAQGRGRGRGPDLGKKCGKFVNCHDARDGRWDGRGPRQDLSRRDIFDRRVRSHRRFGNFNDSGFVRARKFHRVRAFNEDRFARGRGLTRVRWQRR